MSNLKSLDDDYIGTMEFSGLNKNNKEHPTVIKWKTYRMWVVK